MPPTSVSNVDIGAIGLSLVTFFGIKKNIVVQSCCGHLLLLLSSNPEGLLGESHRIPLLFSAFYHLEAFSRSLIEPWQCFLPFLKLLIVLSLPFKYCSLSSHCQCSAHSFLFALLLLSVLFPDLVQKPSTAFRTLDHLIHPLLMHVFQFLSSSSFFFVFSNQS